MANELLTIEDLQRFADRISPYLGMHSDIYELDEIQVGTWIDGKPVYQKIIHFDYINLVSAGTYYYSSYDLTSLSIKINISIEGSLYDSLNDARYPITLISPNSEYSLYCRFEDKRLFFLSNSSYGTNRIQDVYAIIKYTKKTDYT